MNRSELSAEFERVIAEHVVAGNWHNVTVCEAIATRLGIEISVVNVCRLTRGMKEEHAEFERAFFALVKEGSCES